MASSDLRRRLSWLIAVRLVVSTTLLGWAILMQVRAQGVENRGFYLLIALTYGLSVFYGSTLRFVRPGAMLAKPQGGSRGRSATLAMRISY